MDSYRETILLKESSDYKSIYQINQNNTVQRQYCSGLF